MSHRATVGTAIANSNATVLAVTINRPVPAGTTLLMGLVWESAAGSVPTISSIVDSRANAWTTSPDDSANSGTTVAGAIVRGTVTTALQVGDTVTVTISIARARWAAQIDAFDDIAASPLDAHTHNAAASASLSTGTTAATVAQAELVYCIYGIGPGKTVTLPAGWGGGPKVETSNGSADRALQATWLYVSATGAQQGTLTLDTSSTYMAAIATYKMAIPRPGVPDVPLFTPGIDPATIPAVLNATVRDPLTFLVAPPVFRARRAGALTVAENVHQFIAWDTVDEDSYVGWGPSQSPAQAASRYVVPVDGQYRVTVESSLSGTGATGLVLIPAVAVNGLPPNGIGSPGWEGIEVFVPTGVSTQPKGSNSVWEVYALAGSYIEIDLWYSTESAIVATDATAGWQCEVDIVFAGV